MTGTMDTLNMTSVSSLGMLTNHAHALLCVSRDPHMRLRDIADCIGITERATHRIVCELEDAGYLTRTRDGARNRYQIHGDKPLPHDLDAGVRVDDLLSVFGSSLRATS